jgi:hypothetical protein
MHHHELEGEANDHEQQRLTQTQQEEEAKFAFVGSSFGHDAA